MPILLNADTSFSSKQELLDLQNGPMGPSLDTPSPLNSHEDSPVDSGPGSPAGEGPAGHLILTRASAPLPGQLYGVEVPTETPLGLKFIPTDSEGLCGWGALTPRAIQTFNTPRWVLFFLCVASFLQGMIINGFINTVVTSIERRFDLRSYQAGLIASSYDIAACVCLAFVSYFGGTGHKPRWLGWGVLVMALGSLVFALPHFTTPPYHVSIPERTGVCTGNRTSPCHDSEGGGLSSYRFVFMLGQFLHGVGATPLYTLGVTYLDENVKSSYAPVYIGIFYTAAIVGPAAGYLLGGHFLNIYTEVHVTTELTPENPLWVGAWWIGFLAGGAAALVIALPILGYPRQLPGSQKYVAMRVSEAHQLKDGSQASASDPQFGKSVKDMPRSVLLLLKNPPFLFLCLAGATEATLIAGMSTFGPKFLESQFSLSASEAATWFGYMVVPAGGGGTFLGGYIVKKLNLRCRGIIRFCMVCALVSLLAIFIFLIHCPNVPMAGVTAPYPSNLPPGHQYNKNYNEQYYEQANNRRNSSLLGGNLTVGCNANCNCLRELYNPVCGDDGVMYYSPCHAGCSTINHTEISTGRQVYSGCSCVVGGNVTSGHKGLARDGKCTSSCSHMPAFLTFLFIIISFTFLCSIPALTATLRCVPDNQRSFGLGIQWIVVRSLGGIPGPIAFGSVIDISCLLWENQCGEQGSCHLYQNSAMSRYTLIAGIIYKVLGTLFFLLASVLYKPPPESPQSSCESTDHGPGDSGGETGDLPIKDLPPEIIANVHTRL
ncbi:solute carrier organic anion transporter family member 4A1 [Salmo salar]|uniref:Solute carrier organic anion transporter family member n=1 Tax=Salmo salar TaxID=8030 RepID=A0A1S3MEG0_SALSA|nr:solute carrier organic anion transporter family member 4A1 [Salmo salar]XP_014001454.1 solute carrier organic anion transporter family member 4A1 [Salmo salar]XP_014001455.1 solute carrier organic anion transporter family member 4A1 [Salmo salar]XP_014001456.1 solute carrier organic anion transporter family member 4A1 [Salmo salar]XP_045552016.1 solute carrier organic anion transporter family member 4A1 [Salmo salar]XP_045552017.1 solute carrier organic anion transporter family member 4A1 [|eukprot:XP_014001453.1 PREDICTED: solute carrier organic anion transporter family member 4A1-like [Salmo salar]